MAEFYVDKIETALGIAEPGKTNLRFWSVDACRAIGMGWEKNGRRYAVHCPFREGWDDHLISMANDLLAEAVHG